MSSYGTVTGKFVTHQEFGGAPVPLSGTVDFVPSSTAVGESTVYALASRTGYVRDGVLFESANGEVQGVKLLAPEGVKPNTLYYTVYCHLVDDAGRAAPIKPAVITIAAGLSVDLSAAVPVSEAVLPSQAPAPGGGGKGEPQRLSLEGRRLSLSDGGGSVVIPETDLTALTIRVNALENRPVPAASDDPVRSVDGGGTYEIRDVQVQGVYAAAAPASHPAGVEWAAGAPPTAYPALLIFVKTGGKTLGYVAGTTATAAAAPMPSPLQPAVLAAPAPKATVTGGTLEISWEPVGGATGYEIMVDGAAPSPASSPHRVQVTPGTSGTVQVRAVKDATHSAWGSVDYAVPLAGEKPVEWQTTWALTNWLQGKVGEAQGVYLREKPGSDHLIEGYEYPVIDTQGNPVPESDPVRKIRQNGKFIQSKAPVVSATSAATISWTGTVPTKQELGWGQPAVGVVLGSREEIGFAREGNEWVQHGTVALPGSGVTSAIGVWNKAPIQGGDTLEIVTDGEAIKGNVVRTGGAKVNIFTVTPTDRWEKNGADFGKIRVRGWTWDNIKVRKVG